MKLKKKWAKEASFKLDLVNHENRIFEKGFIAGVEYARLEVLKEITLGTPLNTLFRRIKNLGEDEA